MKGTRFMVVMASSYIKETKAIPATKKNSTAVDCIFPDL